MEGLGILPGAAVSSARAASADGSVIVGYSDGASSSSFRWENGGAMVEIPDLPGDAGSSQGGAWGVSDDGTVVVGAARSAQGREAYIWKQGVATEGLGFLSDESFDSFAFAVTGDGSTVVGYGTNSDNREQAFRWTDEAKVMEPLGDSGYQSQARDVSADGSVVVGFDVTSQVTVGRGRKTTTVSIAEAFRWTEATGIMVPLGDLPGGEHWSEARAVSANGSVIAGSSSSSKGWEAVVWEESNGIRSLQDVLVTDFGLDLAGWQLELVWDMTPDGLTFVGEGINPEGNREGFIAKITPPGPGITITPSSGLQTSEDGTTADIDVVLDAAPTAPVTIDVSSSNTAEGEIEDAVGGVLTLTFDTTNWNVPKTVTVVGVEDTGQQDGDQVYSIELNPSSAGDPAYDALSTVFLTVTNLDNEVPPVSTMFVAAIDLVTTPSGGNKVNHHIEVLVMQDNGANDLPLAGVHVTVTFAGKTFTGLTDNDGIFRSAAIKGVKSGDYFANVVDLALADFQWDPLALDLEDDSDNDGLPDDLVTI